MIEQQGRLEISQTRVLHNVQAVRTKLGRDIQICATVKANAYGHGLREMVQILRTIGVNWLAVYSLDEVLPDLMHDMAVLVLAPLVIGTATVRERWDTCISHLRSLMSSVPTHVRINITDEASAHALLQTAQNGNPINIHMQVDTGLTRGGVALEKAIALADLLAQSPSLKLEGIFSHFSHGDEAGHATIPLQMQRLQKIAAQLKPRHPNLLVHLQNSGGVWNAQDESLPQLNMARAGIALYGLQPNLAAPIPNLLPIAKLIAPILAIHDRPPGTGVGYGHAFITTRPSRLAIVPVGYADGYPRALSNRGIVQIHNTDAPIVGRVSMDQIIIDITHLPDTQIGDDVTVITWDPTKPNCIDRIAAATETIGYEIATGLGPRLRRVVVS
ncbi:MAG: alanine racemase [Phycisphaerales bacterium]|nr:alanine racemase [Phycisphaerales bacterium]